MKLDTAIRHLDELRCIITSVFASAKCYHPTSIELHQNLSQRVFDTNKYKKLPNWAQDKLIEFMNVNRKEMQNKYIKLFYIGLDGRKIPTHKAWDLFTEEEKDLLRSGNESIPIHHLWMKETIVNHDDGSVTITLIPTDKLYWTAAMKE